MTLFYPNGQPIPEVVPSPVAGRTVISSERDKELEDVSGGLTPAKIAAMFKAALEGDTAEQCQLALEIAEKNWDIFHALDTRALEVSRTDWTIDPADATPKAKEIAEYITTTLEGIHGNKSENLVSFRKLIRGMMSAVSPGFSCHEIVWRVPGKEIEGFSFIPQPMFKFKGNTPLLVTENEKEGVELSPYKFVWHRHEALWGSVSRGGLIRPLGWLYVFTTLNWKDLMRYAEKMGVPFLYASIPDSSFQAEARKIANLMRNFGSDGTGVFSDGTTINSVERKAGGEDVFIKIQEIVKEAISKLVLGTASTSDSDTKYSNAETGLETCQKYREDDCDNLADTILTTIIKPLVELTYGADTPLPKFRFLYEPAENTKQATEEIKTLAEAGWEVEAEQIEERTSWKVTKKVDAQPVESPTSEVKGRKSDVAALSASSSQAPDQTVSTALQDYLAGTGQEEWFGPLQTAIVYALSAESEDEMKDRLQTMIDNSAEMMDSMDSTQFASALEGVVYKSYMEAMVSRGAAVSSEQ